MIHFEKFPKIPRIDKALYAIVTEKLDGVNAQIAIENGCIVGVGSRNRWITPDNDNYGFAKWVQNNVEELLKLGDGRHYGEWFGQGIQRTYHLYEKRFALFNVKRWRDVRPTCCDIVPVLFEGNLYPSDITEITEQLKKTGSLASPGFKNPEGIIIYYPTTNTLLKWTYENSEGKWANT